MSEQTQDLAGCLVSRSLGLPASYRRDAIDRYQIIDTATERDFDNIVKLAAQIFGVPYAAISFVLEDRQWFKAQQGLGFRETPIEQSFCAHALASSDIFWVADAREAALFADNPLVTGAPGIRFYAGARVLASDGTPVATLCVFDSQPRGTLPTLAEELTLKVLASQVESLLELRRALIQQRRQSAHRAALTRKLRRVAERDDLTDLPRRGLFRKRLEAVIGDAGRQGGQAAVLLIDVDHFKMVNDTLGHDVGDALLMAFAKRLRAVTRKGDLIARLGGDEFGVILTDVTGRENLETMVNSLQARLHRPFRYRDRMIECQASVGVAIYPDDAVTVDALIKCSDLALANAKSARGGAEFFDASMAEAFEAETRMLNVARAGVAERRMMPYYQPKIDLQTGALIGFEALVRCHRPNEAPLLPEIFSHAFSDQKLAVAIGAQMLDHVLADMRDWTDRNIEFGHVAINSCAADFRADDYGERLLQALVERQLDPGMIELEVTEGVFLGREAHHVARALALLSQNGIKIALDDFGTGFASLTHLKQFPVDIIKIDRSFISGIGNNPDDTNIVRALIGLGKSLGIKTVAEGVETVAQSQFVSRHGCNFGQGYLYGVPVPAHDVPALINEPASFGDLRLRGRTRPYRNRHAHDHLLRQQKQDRCARREIRGR